MKVQPLCQVATPHNSFRMLTQITACKQRLCSLSCFWAKCFSYLLISQAQ